MWPCSQFCQVLRAWPAITAGSTPRSPSLEDPSFQQGRLPRDPDAFLRCHHEPARESLSMVRQYLLQHRNLVGPSFVLEPQQDDPGVNGPFPVDQFAEILVVGDQDALLGPAKE
ncbi:hypothetical protein JCM17961_46240 [Endothiovibrio diazotrophicus]